MNQAPVRTSQTNQLSASSSLEEYTVIQYQSIFAGSINVGAGPSLPVQFGVQPKSTREHQVDRKYIRGHSEPDETYKDNNVAVWTLEENKGDPKGVLLQFFCAVVAKHYDRRFRAEVKVKVETGLAAGIVDPRYWKMWAKPWDKDDPLIFHPENLPDCLILDGAKGFDLSKLTEPQCRSLAPLPDENQVLPSSV